MVADARPRGIRLLLAVLLVVATGAFVWGAFAERSGHHEGSSESATVTTPSSAPSTDGASSTEPAGEPATTTTPKPASCESASECAGESGSTTAASTPATNESPPERAGESSGATTPPTTGESAAQHATESAPTTATPSTAESAARHAAESGSGTTTPGSGESAAQHAAESGTGTTSEATGGEFHPLGVNLESTPLVIFGALFSLVLAGIVVPFPRRGVLGLVVLVGAAFAALEVAEVVHQVSQSRPGLVALAVIAGLLHAAVAVLAASLLVNPRHVATA